MSTVFLVVVVFELQQGTVFPSQYSQILFLLIYHNCSLTSRYRLVERYYLQTCYFPHIIYNTSRIIQYPLSTYDCLYTIIDDVIIAYEQVWRYYLDSLMKKWDSAQRKRYSDRNVLNWKKIFFRALYISRNEQDRSELLNFFIF